MKSLILAGGSGTRLFPLSRTQFPKQFIKIIKNTSLFQKTIQRALHFSKPDEIYVVTNKDHYFLVKDQLGEINADAKIIVEPAAKNTLPAIYLGIREIVKDSGRSTVAIFPSDHLVTMSTSMTEAFSDAEPLTEKYLIIFGVQPTSPHTGYGYIKPGKRIGSGFRVAQFVEKPDHKNALEYVSKGFFWNSGIFLVDSDLFFAECRRYAKEVVAAFDQPQKEAYNLEKVYDEVPSLSIDYGIMEKTTKAVVIPLTTDWSDVGNFNAIYSVLDKNEDQNAIIGKHVGINSTDNLIISERLVTTADIHDMTIIETMDAILVCPRSSGEKVKDIVRILADEKDERVNWHTTVHRPWGSFTSLEDGGAFRIKRVSVRPKHRLSLQMHHHRSEHWVVVRGTAKVTIGDRDFLVKQGESTYVPAGVIHRLENPGIVPLEVIEVQLGEYLKEDDIVRFEDDFKRVDKR